jgi:hypothetical protein
MDKRFNPQHYKLIDAFDQGISFGWESSAAARAYEEEVAPHPRPPKEVEIRWADSQRLHPNVRNFLRHH